MKQHSYIVLLLFAFAGIAGCKKSKYEKYGEYGTIDSGGKKRKFIVHVPSGYREDSSYSLVIALHGRFGDPTDMAVGTGFSDAADFKKFIVCYPEGYKKSWADSRNVTPASEAGIDDVTFISDLIDKLIADYSVDTTRIYVAGISNGGFLAQDIACALSGKITAFASVVASMPEPLKLTCNPVRPVPAMFILSTTDELIPYAGGDIVNYDAGRVLSADSTIAFWVNNNNCMGFIDSTDLLDAKNDGTTVTEFIWANCDLGAGINFYRVNNGGHNWPGGKPVWSFVSGNQCEDIDATLLIWDFFKDYVKP